LQVSGEACLTSGGADRGRTDDLLVANEALSQLSYSPRKAMTRYGIRVQSDFDHNSKIQSKVAKQAEKSK
jgi:hypothetical protein